MARRERSIGRLRLLWSRRQFFLRVAVTGIVVSTVVAFAIPTRYTSTARLMPPEQRSSSAATLMAMARVDSAGSSLPLAASSVLGMSNSAALFAGVLRSRVIQDHLLAQFELKDVYGVRKDVDAREKLQRRTEIAEDRRTGIITVRVTDRDPNRAAAMAAAYVAELNRVVTQLSTSSARRERLFLEQRLAEVKQELESAEQQLSEFASRHAAVDLKEQGRAILTAAATLQGELIAAESELQGLRQIYTENNIRLRVLKARVAELRGQLARIGGAEGIGQASDAPHPSLRQLPLLALDYAELFRQVKVQESVFEVLTRQYELAKAEEARQLPSVSLLDPPEVPERKSFPPRLLIITAGLVLSMAFGMAYTVLGVTWQEMKEDDPRRGLALEVADTVRGGWGRLTQRLRRSQARPSGEEPNEAANSEGQPATEHEEVLSGRETRL